jgi:hypothetical protein
VYLDFRGAEEAPTESIARQVKASRAFSFPPPMTRSTALESHMYGDPMAILEAKQAREKRQAQQEQKRPVLTLKRKSSDGWSEARKKAEALFDLPAAPRSEA